MIPIKEIIETTLTCNACISSPFFSGLSKSQQYSPEYGGGSSGSHLLPERHPPPPNQYFQPVQHQMYNTLRGLGPISGGHHSGTPRIPDTGGGGPGGGSTGFSDPFIEPEFLTQGQRLEVVLGDTVVLPCKLNHLGKKPTSN